jgi:peptide/nickel transport system permease protein
MLQTITFRLLAAIPSVFLVSVLAFTLVYLMPGSVSQLILGEAATPEAIDALDAELGYDRSIVVQYLDWAGDALRGDFGNSLITQREVSTLIFERLPVTLSLAAGALLVSIVLGIGCGVVAALRHGSLVDRALSLGTAAGLSVPSFWAASLLAFWIGVELGWLPASGYTPFSESPVDWFRSLILPSLALGIGGAANIARQMRNGLVEVMGKPYIRTAWSKGLSSRRVVVVHAMKNALIPVATVVGFQASMLLSGSIVVEQVFGLPGIGSQTVRAVLDQDIPVIQAVVMVTAITVILVNIVVDSSYAVFDPRVRVT